MAIVGDMAEGLTTARLNRKQRGALRAALVVFARGGRKRHRLQREFDEVAADRKRLRRALDDMRIDRDRHRRRADELEAGGARPGCGKVPLNSAGEARSFIELVCAKSGERRGAYAAYLCREACEPRGEVWHIGHVQARAERAGTLVAPLADLLDPETAARLGVDPARRACNT